MSEKRTKIIETIRRLKNLTSAKGCTEAEAMAAAEKVAALMAQYAISDGDIEIESTSCKQKRRSTVRDHLIPIIAKCTNTSSILVKDHASSCCEFYGQFPGPQIAYYLRDICFRAIDREVKTFKQSKFYKARRVLATKRKAVEEFTHAMVMRLRSRLIDLFRQSIHPAQAIIANQYMLQKYPQSKDMNAPVPKRKFFEASVAGWVAGNNVGLHHGIDGSGKPSPQLSSNIV